MSTCSNHGSDQDERPAAESDPAVVGPRPRPLIKPAGGGVLEARGPVQPKQESTAAVRPFTWRDLTGTLDTPWVRVRLGSLRLTGEEQRALQVGSVVRLDQPADAPVEIMAGRHVLACGCVVLVDGQLAVQVTSRRQPVRRQSA
jgi:hypothetical protein